MAETLRLNLDKYTNAVGATPLSTDIGKLTRVVGFLLEGYLPGASIGSLCRVYPHQSKDSFVAEVIGFRDKSVLMMPLGEIRGVGLGARIILERQLASVSVSEDMVGRVLNGLGEPIDGKGEIEYESDMPLYAEVRNPLERTPITESLDMGVRAINGLTTIGKGQRVGIMAGSGVGKSVLMGMLARDSSADVNVIALVGERGRELREFIENDLGEEGLKKSVVIVATSDQSPLVRMRAAFVASAIAEYFSGEGKDVLLMMDSITRFAMAQREIGLNVGEPPTTKGYTPSVFSLLPKLLERAGNFENQGNITGLYTVLVEGDDMDEPIADAVRSIVDGHIVLSRNLAQKGQFPAIDILQSTSRVMRNTVDPRHLELAQMIRQNMAVYRDAEDLVSIGAYKDGSNFEIDQAVELNRPINDFLKQGMNERVSMVDTLNQMEDMLVGTGES